MSLNISASSIHEKGEGKSMASDQLQQLKNEIQQKLPEILSNLSEVIQKYGVSGAVECELKLDINKLQYRLQGRDNLQCQELVKSTLLLIEERRIKLGVEDTKVTIGNSIEQCPCQPHDPPDVCCWVSS